MYYGSFITQLPVNNSKYLNMKSVKFFKVLLLKFKKSLKLARKKYFFLNIQSFLFKID